ncbi:hypothetical protein Taro_010574 [Colocasia esculenta]|uniref:Uncharacterized protein n=1 Tax=Colocasia esculenta TaxID=4460 RepID=A0A843TZA8_COLES|nr:hypothetical protein [Colocasia esculenta]
MRAIPCDVPSHWSTIPYVKFNRRMVLSKLLGIEFYSRDFIRILTKGILNVEEGRMENLVEEGRMEYPVEEGRMENLVYFLLCLLPGLIFLKLDRKPRCCKTCLL